MKPMRTAKGVVLGITVKPKSSKFKIQLNDKITVFCKEAPVKGRVNRRVEKELARLFKRKAVIVSGFSGRKKRILIEKTSVEEVERVLTTL